jgi:hypothetical protein
MFIRALDSYEQPRKLTACRTAIIALLSPPETRIRLSDRTKELGGAS